MATNEELVILAREGNTDATNELLKRNDGLFYKISKRYQTHIENLDDLMSLCRIKAWLSLESYDQEKNVQYHKWLSWVLENYLKQNYIKNRRKKKMHNAESLNKIIKSSKDADEEMVDTLIDEQSSNYLNHLIDNDFLCDVFECYLNNDHDYIDFQILEARFYSGYTQQEIAKHLGKSHTYVQKREKKILGELRYYCKQRLGKITRGECKSLDSIFTS